MQLYKALKVLISFVIVLPLFSYGQASALNTYNHSELLEYEGYGKAMYESIVEQTTFITGQYTDNKEYVSDSIDEIIDYANFWKSDFENWDESCTEFIGCMRDMLENGAGYVLTVGDWFKKMFTDYEEQEEEDFAYSAYFVSGEDRVQIVDGYYFKINGESQMRTYIGMGNYPVSGNVHEGFGSSIYLHSEGINKNLPYLSFPTKAEAETFLNQRLSNKTNPPYVLGLALEIGWDITVHKKDDNTLVVPDNNGVNRPSRDIINHLNKNGVPPVVTPQLKPVLVCPDGARIQMSIDGSTFLSANGEVMLVNKDGTANVSGSLCNLNWQKPDIKYVDGKVVIEDLTDPDGNYEDVLCKIGPANCKPISKEEAAVEKIDKSLLQYVKNAYEYGTGVLKTATDGLKSLATGAKDLTSLFSTFFSWLPNEIVVLMASGLGITVGLRLFRK